MNIKCDLVHSSAQEMDGFSHHRLYDSRDINSREREGRRDRTPLKNSTSLDGSDSGMREGRGYSSFSNSNNHRHLSHSHSSSFTSPSSSLVGSFSYSALGEFSNAGRVEVVKGLYNQYGSQSRRESSQGRGNTGDSWDQGSLHSGSSQKDQDQTERVKEKKVLSIYGRGGDDAPSDDKPIVIKYHNPCRFAGHDHEWKNCPNNFRNKKSRGFTMGSGNNKFNADFKGGLKDGADSSSGISKSKSWGGNTAKVDYYGPASETDGSNIKSNSRVFDNSTRGYSKLHDTTCPDLPILSSRNKLPSEGSSRVIAVDRSCGLDSIPVSGGSDFDNSSTYSPLSLNLENSIENKWRKYDITAPAPVSKPRSSPITSSTITRGYSSSSFTPTSTGPRRKPVHVDSITTPTQLNRAYSADAGSMVNSKNLQQNADNISSSSSHRKLAASNSFLMDGLNTTDTYLSKGSATFSPHQTNDNSSSARHDTAGSGSPQQDRRGLLGTSDANSHAGEINVKLAGENEDLDDNITANSPAISAEAKEIVGSSFIKPATIVSSLRPNTEEEKSLFLTCDTLEVEEKVRKAEDIVNKMNLLMMKEFRSLSEFSPEATLIPLPSKNEILKCMSAIDSKIKLKEDNAILFKEKVMIVEREKLEEQRLAIEEKERQNQMINAVQMCRSERESFIQIKSEELSKLLEVQNTVQELKRKTILSKFEKDCEEVLYRKTMQLDSDISSLREQVHDVEKIIEEINIQNNFSAKERMINMQEISDESALVESFDVPVKMSTVIGSIIEKNQRIAIQAHHNSLTSIPFFPEVSESSNTQEDAGKSPTSVITNEEWSNRARKVTGLADALYVEPMHVPMFEENNRMFLKLSSQIKECIKSSKQELNDRREDLANQYLVRQMIYNEDTGVNTETSERGGFFSMTCKTEDLGELSSLVRGNNPYRRPRRGLSPGDVVRSEYEQEQIIAEIAAKEAMEKRIKEGGCPLPHQQIMLESQLFASFSNGFSSHRINDSLEDEEERKNVNIWTDMEKCIFLDRFFHHPKDFRKIATFLRNKSTKDCIQFYYNSKKTIPYKHALKEFLQRRKRQGNIIGWDATIQASLSVGAVIKPGDCLEKPLKFSIPKNDHTYLTHSFHPMKPEIFDNLVTTTLHTKNFDEGKVKDKQKRSNWFILDASCRKYIKQHKEEKDHHVSKRKATSLQGTEQNDDTTSGNGIESAPKKIQRIACVSSAHSEQASTLDEKKPPIKSQKWTAEEKVLFFQAVDKFGHNWAQVSEAVGTRSISQVKNYFYDHKKQSTKKKKMEKANKSDSISETLSENGKIENPTADKKNKTSGNKSDGSQFCIKSRKEDDKLPPQTMSHDKVLQPSDTPFLPESRISKEEDYQKCIVSKQSMNLPIKEMQKCETIHDNSLHQQLLQGHDTKRFQAALRIKDACQRHQEEIMRQRQPKQQLPQFHQNQCQQGSDWVQKQRTHNFQSLLEQHQEQPNNQANHSLHQSNIDHDHEMECLIQSRLVSAAAASSTSQSSLEAALATSVLDCSHCLTDKSQHQQQPSTNSQLLHSLAELQPQGDA